MPKVHLLNVAPGDCSIIEHASGRITMVDICSGNMEVEQENLIAEEALGVTKGMLGNFRMCENLTNPIDYLYGLGKKSVFRFVLTHPDMDHMDGLSRLLNTFNVNNFWDSGARRSKPDFGGYGKYLEEDWDAYERIISGRQAGTSTGQRLAGDSFSYANKKSETGQGHDGLFILAPSKDLLCDPNENDDINESSYVLCYNSSGGKIILPGDAHDLSWQYAIDNHKECVENCSFLLAPHHGRDSDRDYSFLDVLNPKLTLIGCSPSKYIDYRQFSSRGLKILTSNQAGNVVLEIHDGYYDVYVENLSFALKCSDDLTLTNSQGYHFLWRIEA